MYPGAHPRPIGTVLYMGNQFAISFERADYEFHGKQYRRDLFYIWSEDDDNWFCKMSFDSAWLPEVIAMAEAAKWYKKGD
jgi:hypothetical protein